METFVGVLLRKTVAFMVFEQRLLPQQVSHFFKSRDQAIARVDE